MSWWDAAYHGSPPWDICAPQPEIVQLEKEGSIPKGKILDIGCGLCENSMFLAKKGYSVTCIDIAQLAIEKSRAKAAEVGVRITFIIGDALHLNTYFNEESFDAIIDSGLFHALDENSRRPFAEQVWRALAGDGRYFMLCFSDKETMPGGPKRISKAEIEATFSGLFKINCMRDAHFVNKFYEEGARAYLVSMTKIPPFW